MEELLSLSDLLDLHVVDVEIDRLLEQRSSLPALGEYRAAHDEATRLNRRQDEAAVALRGTSLELDKTNGELDLAEEKLKTEENRLYAGGLSARDTDFLRQEVEMLRRRMSSMEDDALELMETREGQEREVALLDEQLRSARGEEERLEARIGEEWSRIDADIARKEGRKNEIVPLSEPDLLELYEELRRTRDGSVVGRLVDGICGACHLKLSAAEEAEVRKESPPRCIHCLAILVV